MAKIQGCFSHILAKMHTFHIGYILGYRHYLKIR